MNNATLDQAQTLANLLEKQPLAGFLGLCIVALVTLFGLLLWEKRSHQKTLREVVALTTTFAHQWDRHLDLEQRMVEHETHESDARRRLELAATVPPMPSTPQERP